MARKEDPPPAKKKARAAVETAARAGLRRGKAGFGGHASEETAQRFSALFEFAPELGVVYRGVAVRDPVAQADRAAKAFRQIPIDRLMVGQDIERRGGVLRRAPPRIRDPVGRQIDTFLNREEDVEAREIPSVRVRHELLDGHGDQPLGAIQPVCSPGHLAGDEVRLDHARPALSDPR
jgi:hypothetical protein